VTGLPGEFGLIARHFRPLAGPGALDLLDDAALLQPPAGRELVVAADAMVEGVHFLPDDPPDTVGAKLLRVNLSDLAAMGADPLAYLMTVSAPKAMQDEWFAAFAAGLAADQARFGVTLLGGDTTSTPGPLTFSLTILGHVAPGAAVRRSGAQPGDEIWVTGTIGDGALGLAALRGALPDPDGALARRYRLPEPRLGVARPDLVHACLDVSDGLVQDLGHLCRAARIGAEIEAAAVPLSPAARAAGPAWLETCLTGGDDYELLMAVPPRHAPALAAHAARLGVPLSRIGRFVQDAGVRVRDGAGRTLRLARTGWSHF
jgi:thiamine-monophosphate kinase